MPLVLRWGRSAYETDADLALEAEAARELGWDWISRPDRSPPADLDHTDILVVNSGVRVTPEVLDRMPGRLVITTTSGFDHIDVAGAHARGFTVARSPMARRDAVVETTLGGILSLLREVPRLQAHSEAGTWARSELPALAPVLLRESTVVVVGAGGVIGSEVCRRLLALDATVVGVDPEGVPEGVEASSLAEALPRADVLTLHCHLTAATEQLVGAPALDRLPPRAVVINTARGKLLDATACVGRVASGRLRGALIDVFPEEPWPDLAAHAAVPGVRLLPHAAGYTPDLGRRVSREVSAALRAHAAGRPIPTALRSFSE